MNEGFKQSNRSVSGTLRTGGQDHFYLETHCCIAIPINEHNEIEVISSSQSPSDLQVGMHTYMTYILYNSDIKDH